MNARALAFRGLALTLGLVVGIAVAGAALVLHLHASDAARRDVDPRLRRLAIVRWLGLDPGFAALIEAVRTERDAGFESVWDFDHDVALSRRLFVPTEMFGLPRHRFRPHTRVLNVLVWSGLKHQALALPDAPDVRRLLADCDVRELVAFTTDAFGFKPIAPSVPGEGPVVFVAGDSFTEGLWTHPADTFVSRLADKLRSAGIPTTPVNLGVHGYSAMEMRWLIEHHAPALDPRVVIVNLFPNDVHARYRDVVRGEGASKADYRRLFHDLDGIWRFARDTGREIVVSTIPAAEQFAALRGHAVFQQRVRGWCELRGVRCLDPRRFFERGDPAALYLSWDPHFSVAGHERYAEFLFRKTRDLLAETAAAAR